MKENHSINEDKVNIIKLIEIGTSYAVISERYGIRDWQCVTSIRIIITIQSTV